MTIVSPYTGKPVESEQARTERLAQERIDTVLVAAFGALIGLPRMAPADGAAYRQEVAEAIVGLVGKDKLKARYKGLRFADDEPTPSEP